MKITRLETLWLDAYPNLCWVRLHDDTGRIGLGETFFGARAVAAYLHESVAPLLLGQDPRRIDWVAHRLRPYVGYRSGGVELRGNSAVDIALWDLLGQHAGQPVTGLLGGKTRERIRVYNTCAGYTYVRKEPRQAVANWGVAQAGSDPAGGGPVGDPVPALVGVRDDAAPSGPDGAADETVAPEATPGRATGSPAFPDVDRPYEDLDAFLHRADELAVSLLDQGITGMKIWPFDPYAEASDGTYISAADLDTALEPFRKIRRAVGDRMDIMVEFHGLWNLPAAKRIVAALEPFGCFWYEDPIRPDNLDALAELAATTAVPLTVSETLATRWGFREAMAAGATGIVMLDVTWCGGLGEAKKIATMAEAHALPVAPHDCTGPVALVASTHLSLNAPNALIQETVRAAYTDWYRELVTTLPDIDGGTIGLPDAPGLGTALRPELWRRDDAHVETSDKS